MARTGTRPLINTQWPKRILVRIHEQGKPVWERNEEFPSSGALFRLIVEPYPDYKAFNAIDEYGAVGVLTAEDVGQYIQKKNPPQHWSLNVVVKNAAPAPRKLRIVGVLLIIVVLTGIAVTELVAAGFGLREEWEKSSQERQAMLIAGLLYILADAIKGLEKELRRLLRLCGASN